MVTPRFPPDTGGVERHVSEVASRLSAAGCSVEVLCTDRTGRRLGTCDHDGVPVTRVRAWPSNRDYYFAPALWREMGRRRYDVIHVQSYHTAVAPLAMTRAIALGTPFVLTFHGGGHSSRTRHGLRGIQRQVLRPLLRRAARLVAVARFEITVYGRELRLPPGRFALIPNGVEPGPTMPLSPDPIVASIGRLERYKGHHRVLEAFPAVVSARPDARLWIVGEGPEEQALRREAAQLRLGDSVEFFSVPADDPAGMADLLRRTRVLVSLSEFETHPLVALEAAAAGRPVVVADGSGLHELVEDGFADAVPPDSGPDVVAEAILRSIDAGVRTGGLDLPTWDDCASRLLTLYEEVACAS